MSNHNVVFISIAIDNFNHVADVNSKQADKCLEKIINSNRNTLYCKDMDCVYTQHNLTVVQ